jgi:hypothetical protein
MTCRVENGEIFNQIYNAENRISAIQKLTEGSTCPAPNTSADVEDISAEWLFGYDGDGNNPLLLWWSV